MHVDLRECPSGAQRHFFLTWESRNLFKTMEPLVGFEPTTCSLRMSCSTPELQRRFTGGNDWLFP
jgi:hypothetical protein